MRLYGPLAPAWPSAAALLKRATWNLSARQNETMDRVVRLMLACVMLASASMTYAAQVTEMAPCAPNTSHNVKTLESFLIVHVECANVLLEIPVPMLNRSILIYTEFAALSTGGSEYAPGTAIDSHNAARWARFGSKVALLTVNYDNWAGSPPRYGAGSRRLHCPV